MRISYPDFSTILNTLEPYQVIRNSSGFNMSQALYDESTYLVSIRILGTASAYFGEEVIPGNQNATSDKQGKNFFWNRWLSPLIDNTIIFATDLEFKPILSIKPLVISENVIHNSCPTSYTDVRLVRSDKNTIYLYNSLVTSISRLSITQHRQITRTPIMTKICNSDVKTYDKNWSYVREIDKATNAVSSSFLFLDWFRLKRSQREECNSNSNYSTVSDFFSVRTY